MSVFPIPSARKAFPGLTLLALDEVPQAPASPDGRHSSPQNDKAGLTKSSLAQVPNLKWLYRTAKKKRRRLSAFASTLQTAPRKRHQCVPNSPPRQHHVRLKKGSDR